MATERREVDPSPEHPPFFIVAAARSGTTLLRVMLDRHPDVAIPPESHFIPRLWTRRRVYGSRGRVEQPERFLKDLAADRRFQSWDLPVEEVRKELSGLSAPPLGEAIAAAYRAYARHRGKRRWGDKTPRYVRKLPLLGRLFPAARFVHMVRDGRDVALSMVELERLHRRAPTPAVFWARQVRSGRAGAAALGPGRYLELRYEDLLDDPAGELRRLCDFLDLAFDPIMLEHDERALESVPPNQRWMHQRIALPPTKGLRDWRTQMDPQEVAGFEVVAGRELVALGYPLAGGRPGASVRARAWGDIALFWFRSLRRRMRIRARRWRRRRAAQNETVGR